MAMAMAWSGLQFLLTGAQESIIQNEAKKSNASCRSSTCFIH